MNDIFISLQVKKPIKVDSFREALTHLKKTLEVPQQNMVRACWWDNTSNDVDSIEEAIGPEYSFSIVMGEYSYYDNFAPFSLYNSEYVPFDPSVESEIVAMYKYSNIEGSPKITRYNEKNIICMTCIYHQFIESKLVRQISIVLYAHLPNFRENGGTAFYGNNYYEHEKIYLDNCLKNFNKLVFWMSWHDVQVIEGTNSTLYLDDKFNKLKELFWIRFNTIEDEKYLKKMDREIIPDGPFDKPEQKEGIISNINYDDIRFIRSNYDHPNAKFINDVEEKFKDVCWVRHLAFEVRKYGSFISDDVNNDMYLAKLENRILVAYLIEDYEYDTKTIKWYWFMN